jgi:hypothetical protein
MCFKIQGFYILPTHVSLYFTWIWEQTAIISIALTDWFFITETERVYCAVRTLPLNIILDNPIVVQTLLDSSIASRRTGFDSEPISVSFMVGEMTFGQIFLRIF